MFNFNPTNGFAIAQIEIDRYLIEQSNAKLCERASAIAPENKLIKVPQRKAKYHDKNRIRHRDVQGWVFRRTGLSTTAEVKAALKKLGKKFDLRLTSAWVAVNLTCASAIAFAHSQSFAQLLLTERCPSVETHSATFKVGDRVDFVEYSPRLAYAQVWSPFQVCAIDENGMAKLDLISFPVPLNQLKIA